MNKALFLALFLIVALPALTWADAADDDFWDDDADDDISFQCSDLCARAVNLCSSSCVPDTYDECMTFCENNLSQSHIDCAQNYSCDNFNECLCGGDNDDDANDDATVDDDADDDADDDIDYANDDADSGDDDNDDDDNDDDNGLFCSVSRGRQSTALTVFMLAVGILAFIFSIRSKNPSKRS